MRRGSTPRRVWRAGLCKGCPLNMEFLPLLYFYPPVYIPPVDMTLGHCTSPLGTPKIQKKMTLGHCTSPLGTPKIPKKKQRSEDQNLALLIFFFFFFFFFASVFVCLCVDDHVSNLSLELTINQSTVVFFYDNQ